MKKLILGSLVVSTMFQTQVVRADNQGAGAIIGGLIGGIIGNQAGRGDARAATTIIGAIAGAVIGSEIGRNMDDADRRAMREAQLDALRGDVNRPVRWDGRRHGSRTGYNGEFRTIRQGRHRSRSAVCREYVSVIYSNDGRREENRGTACSFSDGSWQEVKSTEISWGGQVVSSTTTSTTVVRNDRPVRPTPPRPVYQPEPTPVYSCGAQYSYALDKLDRMDGDLVYWNSEMVRAPYGSGQKDYALRQVREVGARMTEIADEIGRRGDVEFDKVERAALSFQRKHDSAAYGSDIKSAYNRVATALMLGMERSFEKSTYCGTTSRELISSARSFNSKGNSAPYGSTLKGTYERLVDKSLTASVEVYRSEARRSYDFRTVEDQGVDFSREYNSAAYGSRLKEGYNQLQQVAYNVSEQLFRDATYRMGRRERYEFVRFYQQKQYSAPYGSLLKDHYGRMLSIAE